MNWLYPKKSWPALALLTVALSGCAAKSLYHTVSPPAADATPPAPAREFRGVWLATVANIDWPSEDNLSADQQKGELIKILDRAVALKFNAVVFQVRPQCDAVYQSAIEPWDPCLTGTMGIGPGYDPLALAVTEAHKRNLELHAWLNPFRALLKSKTRSVAPNHISKTHPEWVLDYGKLLWLDPGIPEARDYSRRVLMDIVRRYDVDGIHFDDYFYPYHEEDAKGNAIPFPDRASREAYLKKGGLLELDDWRRWNVDSFVESAYKAVKNEKPWVKFGIAPFGVWKSGQPVKTKNTDSYGTLYGDARKWLNEGWVDYLSPQLYWSTDHPDLPFEKLLQWWVAQNPGHRGMWPGLFDSSVGDKDKDTGKIKISAAEIAKQIQLDRQQAGDPGTVHFSMVALMKNRGGLADELEKLYAKPALVPASPWLGREASAAPKISVRTTETQTTLRWTPASGKTTWQWVVQKKNGAEWTMEILSGQQTTLVLPGSTPPDAVAVRAIDRFGNAGAPAILKKKS